MKKIFLLSFIILLFISCANKKKNVNDNSSEEKYKMVYGPNLGQLGIFLYFYENGKFNAGPNFEGAIGFSGSYIINGQNIELTIENCDGDPKITEKQTGIKFEGTKIIFNNNTDNNNLYFTEYIVSNNKIPYFESKFWNQNKTRKKGENLVFNKFPIEIINEKGKYKKETLFYSEPSKNSKIYTISFFNEDEKKMTSQQTVPDAFYNMYNEILIIGLTIINNEKWYCVKNLINNGNYISMKINNTETANIGYSWVPEESLIK